jgi:phage gp36-like protein
MAVASQHLYLTEDDLISRLSTEGVLARLDADNDGRVDQVEQQTMTDTLSDASETINFYTWMKYDPGVLVSNPWVNRRAVDLAAWVLCAVRLNPVPEGVEKKALQAQKWLEEIADGPRLIPFAPLRRRLAPVYSNTRIVPGFQLKCIRVEPNTSSPASPGVEQFTDWAAAFTFEI